MAVTKSVILCLLLSFLGNAEAALRDQVFRWEDVAAFLAGCFAVMILLIGTGFFLHEMVCRQYFKEPAAEYYAVRGELPNAYNENTRL
ncbi:hypothetical protein HOLleu_25918 [Holothuria leucospilota]|uniref:Uncharacterized protein n=1 Tax=Holothuria leucospilota TaxID=206669 RepID=A0A9Q1H4V3_HOLLE|nr:hypothetical protein HOLleu_25918 [Holothuria leucospilota]